MLPFLHSFKEVNNSFAITFLQTDMTFTTIKRFNCHRYRNVIKIAQTKDVSDTNYQIFL